MAQLNKRSQSLIKPDKLREGESESEAGLFLSHSFNSQFTQKSQPGGTDFEEERSVARLNLKCQMLSFDFAEKSSLVDLKDKWRLGIFPSYMKSKILQAQTASFNKLFQNHKVLQPGRPVISDHETATN